MNRRMTTTSGMDQEFAFESHAAEDEIAAHRERRTDEAAKKKVRRRILIADDDRNLLQALTVRLDAAGYDVITTQDAYQALDFARKHRPDLLLLDINMPAGSGFSVHERIAKVNVVQVRSARE